MGYYMVVYLAALQGISQDLYEAASIDGATGFQEIPLYHHSHVKAKHVFRYHHDDHSVL